MTTAPRRFRLPAVAGRFYTADPAQCAAEAARLIEPAPLPAAAQGMGPFIGAIVPHAGWLFSGRVAGEVFAALAARHPRGPVTIVITGSVHTMAIWGPTVDSADAWQTPLGPVEVDAPLRQAMLGLPEFQALDMAHENEHSMEVELPLMKAAFGDRAKFVACLIPPAPQAVEWGRSLGELLKSWQTRQAASPDPSTLLVVCSTDLTHYGPNYRFAPKGVGPEGCHWAHEVNDVRLIDLMQKMDPAACLADARQYNSACGGGAIAATLEACRLLGAGRGLLLSRTNSMQVMAQLGHAERENSVGYAGMLFG